jgi:hypothetical protein
MTAVEVLSMTQPPRRATPRPRPTRLGVTEMNANARPAPGRDDH